MVRTRRKVWSVLAVLMVLSLVLSSVAYAAPLAVKVTAQDNKVYNYDYTKLGTSQALANHFKNSFQWAFMNNKKVVIDDSAGVKVDFDSTFKYGGSYADTVQAVLGGSEPQGEALQPTHNMVEENGQVVEKPVETEPGQLEVVSVSAINPTTVEVTFNQEDVEFTKSDVTVKNTETNTKQYVKAVTIEKGVATIEFYEALESGNTYDFIFNIGEETVTASYKFVVAEVAKIVATNQVVPAEVPTAIKYKVYDVNGLDVTDDVQVEFESTVPITNGEITLGNSETAFVVIKYTNEDGTVIKSDRITVKGETPKVAKLLNWTLATGSVNFDDEGYVQNKLVKAGTTPEFYLQVEDQFGNKHDLQNSNILENTIVTYESLDKTVALVDKNTGVVTPIATGTVPVKIMFSQNGVTYFSETVEITVGEQAKFSAIELNKTDITLSSSLLTPESVTLTFKDQFGDKIVLSNATVTATVKTGTGIITLDSTTETITGTNATFTINPVQGKEGTATVEFAVEGTTIKAVVNVTVVKAGAVADYTVEGFKSQLNKYNDPATEENESQMTLKVYAVDANGVKVNQVVEYLAGEIEGVSDGVSIVDSTIVIDASNFEAGKSYDVTIKVGSLPVFSGTFEVVDTTPKPTVELTKSSLTVGVGQNIVDCLKEAFEVTGKLGDQPVTADNITDVLFSTDNSSIIENGVVASEGSATFVIRGVVINDVTIELDNELLNITAVAPSLTYTGLQESYTVRTEEPSGSDNNFINGTPIKVTLTNNTSVTWDKVRIAPVDVNNIQLWAYDNVSEQWYDINKVGWGPPAGFMLTPGYTADTDVYVGASVAGSYDVTVKLINVDNNKVITSITGTINVVNAE
ncbi:hypothetical protein SAMN02745218_00006 [Desulfofundulus australicus DSM 11792]|uniref:Ig-like domain (Group 3) n=1 Tax=Desulfofundulus australicus DSM 11792 TaxID=1121425 RepID=A0A1M4S7Z5_9FIRM|nr:hypothetical protein [Desulfofundulus australicus]SHE28157.1 hypothetical protein SAMN02745218_00006 [Desulfofundulus australicus DSM 11792]